MNIEYKIGDVIYLATDPDQLPRVVKGVLLNQSGVQYELGSGELNSWHWNFEITKKQNVLLKTNS